MSLTPKERSLLRAVSTGNLEKVKSLLAAGVDVNARDKDGNTVLMWAASDGYAGIVKLFLDQGADVNVRDKDGRTALMYVSSYLRRYICSGFSYCNDGSDNKAALREIVVEEHKRTARLLFEAGAKLLIKDRWGNTAADLNKIPEVKELITTGLRVESKVRCDALRLYIFVGRQYNQQPVLFQILKMLATAGQYELSDSETSAISGCIRSSEKCIDLYYSVKACFKFQRSAQNPGAAALVQSAGAV